MPMLPPSSMPVPTWFLRQTATIQTRTAGQETSGAYELTNSTTYTVACCVQPNSSSDASIYKRETGRTLFTIYLGPQTTTGVVTSTIVNHIATVTVDSVVYQVDGEPLDLCSNGVVFQLNAFREV
jgi:hypothetical protein